MAVTAAYRDYVLEQVARAGVVTTRRMFGAIGLYCDGLFFGLIDDDTLFFKAGDTNRADYEARGMRQFMPRADQADAKKMAYFEVPADVLEDAEELVAWARKSGSVRNFVCEPDDEITRSTRIAVRTGWPVAPWQHAMRWAVASISL